MRGERGQTAAETLGVLLVVERDHRRVVTTDAGAKIASESKRLVCEIARRRLRAPRPARRRPGGLGAVRPRRPAARRPDAARAAVPRLGHRLVHRRRAPARDVRAQGQARRVGAGRRRAQARAHADLAGRQRLPVAEPLDPDQAAARRERRGQGREGRRRCRATSASPRSSSSPSRPTTRTTSPTATARRRTPSTRARSNGRERSSSTRTSTPASRPRALPRAPARAGLRRGPPRVQRRQAHRRQRRCGSWSATRTSSAGAQARRQLKDAQRLAGQHKDLSDGKLHAVDIDISTEAGWNAYQAFLASGRLPQPGAPARRTRPRPRPSATPTRRARGQARRPHARRARRILRGPLDRDRHHADGTTESTNFRYSDTASRCQPARTPTATSWARRRSTDARRRGPVLPPVALRAHGNSRRRHRPRTCGWTSPRRSSSELRRSR